MANTKKVDGKLLNQFINEDVGDPELPYNFSTSGDNLISVNAWTEFGASFGRVLLDKGPHYFKGGITLKYLAGVANGYLRMSNLQGTLDADPTGVYLAQTAGTLGVGFGGDIGFVYEFRPFPHGYLLRAGVALLDVGSISYKQDASRTGAYTTHVTGAERLYVNEFGEVDNYKQFMDSHPQYFTAVPLGNGSSYSVSRPCSRIPGKWIFFLVSGSGGLRRSDPAAALQKPGTAGSGSSEGQTLAICGNWAILSVETNFRTIILMG